MNLGLGLPLYHKPTRKGYGKVKWKRKKTLRGAEEKRTPWPKKFRCQVFREKKHGG